MTKFYTNCVDCVANECVNLEVNFWSLQQHPYLTQYSPPQWHHNSDFMETLLFFFNMSIFMNYTLCVPSVCYEAPGPGQEYVFSIIVAAVAVVLSVLLIVTTYVLTKWCTKNELLNSSSQSSDDSPESCEVHWSDSAVTLYLVTVLDWCLLLIPFDFFLSYSKSWSMLRILRTTWVSKLPLWVNMSRRPICLTVSHWKSRVSALNAAQITYDWWSSVFCSNIQNITF